MAVRIQARGASGQCCFYRNGDEAFCLLKHVGGSSFIFGITHPAYPRAWTYAAWSPWVNAALDKAMQLNGNGNDSDQSEKGLVE